MMIKGSKHGRTDGFFYDWQLGWNAASRSCDTNKLLVSSTMGNETEVTQEIMLMFYHRLYPFKSIFQWLNHEHTPTRLFTHREFAFTLANDAYLRYNSFTTAEELKKQVCHLVPKRFEIGPVYSARPKDKKTLRSGTLQPLLRELVFDIDMTDYDPVRTCCSDAGICKKCWPFISAAVKILDKAIRNEFGYEKLLWVYSGRRGIHLWISDKEAMELTDAQRKAVVGWLGVVQLGKDGNKKLNIRNGGKLPPSLESARDYLKDVFAPLILYNQNLFATKEGYEDLLKMIPDAPLVQSLRKNWDDDPNLHSETKWMDLFKHTSKNVGLRAVLEDVIIHYMYPRLDAEVSKHRNHLLKAPFCVHPKTGRVCVPVDPETVDAFDPVNVPTVGQLIQELDEAITDSTTTGGKDVRPDWEKTSLKPYVEFLDKHVKSIMVEVRQEKLKSGDISW